MSKIISWPFTSGWPLRWFMIGLICFGARALLFALRLNRSIRVDALDDAWRFFQIGRHAYLVDILGVAGGFAMVFALVASYFWLEKKFYPGK